MNMVKDSRDEGIFTEEKTRWLKLEITPAVRCVICFNAPEERAPQRRRSWVSLSPIR